MVRSIERETFILVINELIFVKNKYFRLYRHRAVPRVLWRVVLISKLRQSASTGELRFYWHRAVRECLGSCGGSLVQLLNCGVLYSYPRCVSLSIQLGYHSYPGGNYRNSSMWIYKKKALIRCELCIVEYPFRLLLVKTYTGLSIRYDFFFPLFQSTLQLMVGLEYFPSTYISFITSPIT